MIEKCQTTFNVPKTKWAAREMNGSYYDLLTHNNLL